MTQLENFSNTRDQLILSLVDQPEGMIRDTIWGDIPLPREVMRILDSTSFQRLRRVEQLGFTSLTWPGGPPTRFEHSIGVFHLTRLAILHLLRRGGFNFTREEINTTLSAALLHDIGHYPYSHAVEELDLTIVRSHETIGREIVMGPEIGKILREDW